MALESLDTVLSQQAFFTGRVVDGLIARPLYTTPVVELVYQAEPTRSYPLTRRLSPDGHYVFFGDPLSAFLARSGGGTLDLRLVVTADRYQERSIDIPLTAADLTVTRPVRQIAGRSVAIPVIAALPLDHTVELLPRPVGLAGRVVDVNSPDSPVPGAQVSVTAPVARGPVTTNAGGYFSLHDLPVALEVTVLVAAIDADPLSLPVVLDYRQPVNQQTFFLDL